MNIPRCCLFTVLTLASLLANAPGYAQTAETLADDTSATETISLFDGRTLDGWQGDPSRWSVIDGAIVGTIPPGQSLDHNTWLIWQGDPLTDFDLRLQFKLSGAAAANSGIQFRCQAKDIRHVSGYQADLDQGSTWLGRIYDEHGRALLVERGSRVHILPDGTRHQQIFAPADQYQVLFREQAWNDYRIVAVGQHIAVYINGTLFSELLDQQTDQHDLAGSLALQLHSGPETKIEFRNLELQRLAADDPRLGTFPKISATAANPAAIAGVLPKSSSGELVDTDFESGALATWTATGEAFRDQPIRQDGIAQRWPTQTSNKHGDHFIGGWEVVNDQATGTLTSPAFQISHPFASFLIGGGQTAATRVELFQPATDQTPEQVIFTASGNNREQMQRVGVDLTEWVGQTIALRLIDEDTGPWGHLNFDDFRFHTELPSEIAVSGQWRSTHNPLLQHLVPNPVPSKTASTVADVQDTAGISDAARKTLQQMHVPAGFSVDAVAVEPAVNQPIAFTFDARGRLWVIEGNSYPEKRPAGEGLDRILIFADRDHNGSFETRTVFTEGLNLASGLAVGHGGVWVGAAPELLFIPDADADDRPDGPPQVLLDGFGFADTHETMNNFLWGPDGWLYGNQGVFNTSRIGKPGAADDARVSLAAGVWRYHPTRDEFEVFAHGGSNQWGLDYDQYGQLFMTHCRSYWGQGPTTHVIQGGHYWNQVNSGYAPFVSSTALPEIPAMRSYLLASARYGHGEGGAGKPGSREVYGGHSHVGTMIYLGDNWPASYRNHLFTHNLHGHQINHQRNVRVAGGYDTLHAGSDVLFCGDRQYVAVDLQCGPDGAVYISDWYDPRHCHNPDAEQWQRGSGRIYRMKYDATYVPRAVDYHNANDDQLVDAQLDGNDWHARMARLVLQERAAAGSIEQSALARLRQIATTHDDPPRRLAALWALHAAGAIDSQLVRQLLTDPSEYVRGWTVQLAVESLPPTALAEPLQRLADEDDSLLVRRYLASAAARVPNDLGWQLVETLSGQPDNNVDRELPSLIWFALAGLMPGDQDRGWRLANDTAIPMLADHVHWYAAKLSPAGRDRLAQQLAATDDNNHRIRLLRLFELGIRGMRGLDQPAGWSAVADGFYQAADPATQQAAQSLGAAFGDQKLFARMRTTLGSADASVESKQRALQILAGDPSPANLPLLLELVDHPQLQTQLIPLLARYDSAEVASRLITELPKLDAAAAEAAMEVLASRPQWAKAVLAAIEQGKLEKQILTAYYARQMANLGDDQLQQQLTRQWGRLEQSSDEQRVAISQLVAQYKQAPLWAYDAGAGQRHFQKLCANCHQPQQPDSRIAPQLAGSGSKGIEYLVENVIDPNAVIGADFQARLILTVEGRVISGLVEKETDSAITVRTATGSETIASDEIERISVSENSFMPEQLLQSLGEREQIELFKYLMSL